MGHYEFRKSIDRLVEVEEFVRELAAREEEIAAFGFKRIEHWPSYEKVEPTLRDFDTVLADIVDFARATDKATWEAIKSVIDSSKLGETLGRIYVQLTLEIARRQSGRIVAFLREGLSAFGVSKRRVFSDSELPIQEIMVALHRLIPLARRADNLYLAQWQVDDEIFKPSNIDRALVITYIEAAIVNIQNASLAAEEKSKLLEYLGHTKIELAEENAPWKKIVGALIIVATLLSGLADAPHAYENVTKAIEHILGTSVQRHLPRPLPALPAARGGVSV